MTTIAIPLAVAIIGILVYALAANTKAQEIGRALMWCGILVTLWLAAGHYLKL